MVLDLLNGPTPQKVCQKNIVPTGAVEEAHILLSSVYIDLPWLPLFIAA